MSLLEKKQVLAAQHEGVCGTAEPLTATEADFIVTNPVLVPNIAKLPRESTDSFVKRAAVTGPHRGRCTFRCEATGDGAAGVPDWATVFLPACGFDKGDANNVFTETTAAPAGTGNGNDATAVRTVTIGLFKDGIYEQIHGAMGSVNFVFVNGEIHYADFDFEGIYTSNADAALIVPTYSVVAPLKFGTSTTCKVATVSTPCATLNINVANTIRIIEDGTLTAGLKHAVIVDRDINGRMDPESATTTTKARRDAFLATPGTEQALEVVIGAANNQITYDAPKMEWANFEPENAGILRDGLPFTCNRNASAVNGALTLTFA